MKVIIKIEEEEEILELDDKTTIKSVLQEKKIPTETVVVKKNEQIVLEEEILEDGDTIEVIRVIYGG